MALALSIFAILLTIYQAYLQRSHNEKSVKPLIQIDLNDRSDLIAVRIQNNGLGPFIVGKLLFSKDDEQFSSIRKCLTLDPRSYHNIDITETTNKVILPNNFLDVFSVRLKEQDTEEYKMKIKQELSALKLKAEGKDMYDNKISIDRDLEWFTKFHQL